MNDTSIEWCDGTINPVIGCSKCSPGCDNCYAERRAAMLAKNPATKEHYSLVIDNGKWNGRCVCIGSNQWFIDRMPKKPSRIFIGSMTDMFHENGLGPMTMGRIWALIQCYPQHTFMMLTKRPENMKHCMEVRMDAPPLPNLWLGVTVCNQAEADAKIPILLSTTAAKRFISVEPILGPVDVSRFISGSGFVHKDECGTYGPECEQLPDPSPFPMRDPWVRGLDWVICGPETGPRARPANYAWVYKIAEQCWSAGTPFFFKGWGEWTPAFYQPDGGYKCNEDVDIPHGYSAKYHVFDENPGIRMFKVGKKRSGRLLEGQLWDQVPS